MGRDAPFLKFIYMTNEFDDAAINQHWKDGVKARLKQLHPDMVDLGVDDNGDAVILFKNCTEMSINEFVPLSHTWLLLNYFEALIDTK